MIRDIPILTDDQCKQTTDMVLWLKDHWIDRNSFYTLGAATYQDDPKEYPAVARVNNIILHKYFTPLLYDISEFFSVAFGMPSYFDPKLAAPGFHIFTEKANDLRGHVHIDEPYTRCEMPDGWHTPFSFTLPVSLPMKVGGLDYWPHHSDAEIEKAVEAGELPKPEYHMYSEGVLTLHDGETPHRISNPVGMEMGDYRITLQGHGAIVDGRVLLYF